MWDMINFLFQELANREFWRQLRLQSNMTAKVNNNMLLWDCQERSLRNEGFCELVSMFQDTLESLKKHVYLFLSIISLLPSHFILFFLSVAWIKRCCVSDSFFFLHESRFLSLISSLISCDTNFFSSLVMHAMSLRKKLKIHAPDKSFFFGNTEEMSTAKLFSKAYSFNVLRNVIHESQV